MSDDANAPDQPTQPSEAIVALDRLVGSWTVTGERRLGLPRRWPLQLYYDPILTTSDRLGEAAYSGAVLGKLEAGEPPCLLTSTDQSSTQRCHVDV
jgi:hypothetical protein